MITPHEFQPIFYSHFLSEFFTIFKNFCNFFATRLQLPPLYLSTQRNFKGGEKGQKHKQPPSFRATEKFCNFWEIGFI